jgi:hypothetical protein
LNLVEAVNFEKKKKKTPTVVVVLPPSEYTPTWELEDFRKRRPETREK